MFVLDGASTTTAREWHPNPTTRGTWAIYQSCIITIGLCVWQSIHLNVQPPKDRLGQQFMRKCKFALTALLAPELVAVIAWLQYRQAKKVQKAVNLNKREPVSWWGWLKTCAGTLFWVAVGPIRLLDFERMKTYYPDRLWQCWSEQVDVDERGYGNAKPDYGLPWTMTMAFYASCGGLIARQDYGIPKTLTVKTILHIAKNEPQSLPHISHEEVVDKSKASIIAKIITCIQAVWFCTTCIARLGQDQAVSLLELNTFGHCVSALLIYLFWWDKPYDVSSHTIVDSSICRYESLLMQCRLSRGFNNVRLTMLTQHSGATGTITAPGKSQSEDECEAICLVWLGYGEIAPHFTTQTIRMNDCIPGTGFRLSQIEEPMESILTSSNRAPIEVILAWLRSLRTALATDQDPLDANVRSVYHLSAEKHAIWQELWDLRQQGVPPEHLANHFKLQDGDSRALLSERANNMQVLNYFSWFTILALTLSSTIYGCLHLLAWSYGFSSSFERDCWRLATVFTMASVPAFVGLAFANALLQLALSFVSSRVKESRHPILKGVRYCIEYSKGDLAAMQFSIFLLVSFVARTFLIGESFAALTISPPSVYRVPTWAAYVPHL